MKRLCLLAFSLVCLSQLTGCTVLGPLFLGPDLYKATKDTAIQEQHVKQYDYDMYVRRSMNRHRFIPPVNGQDNAALQSDPINRAVEEQARQRPMSFQPNYDSNSRGSFTKSARAYLAKSEDPIIEEGSRDGLWPVPSVPDESGSTPIAPRVAVPESTPYPASPPSGHYWAQKRDIPAYQEIWDQEGYKDSWPTIFINDTSDQLRVEVRDPHGKDLTFKIGPQSTKVLNLETGRHCVTAFPANGYGGYLWFRPRPITVYSDVKLLYDAEAKAVIETRQENGCLQQKHANLQGYYGWCRFRYNDYRY